MGKCAAQLWKVVYVFDIAWFSKEKRILQEMIQTYIFQIHNLSQLETLNRINNSKYCVPYIPNLKTYLSI